MKFWLNIQILHAFFFNKHTTCNKKSESGIAELTSFVIKNALSTYRRVAI